MANENGKDPLVQFRYTLEIGDKVSGFFTEVSGLGVEYEEIQHKVVDKGQPILRTIPGRPKWEKITLKRGVTDNSDIWDWLKEVGEEVEKARVNGAITVMDQNLKPTARFDFVNAYPLKVSGPQLKADGNEVAIEEVTIAHEGLWRNGKK
jgi:phage tail-like protein